MHKTNQRKSNTTKTSDESFIKIVDSGKSLSYRQQILDALSKHQPLTSRSLSTDLGIERISICSPLLELVNETNPQIKKAFVGVCPVTNRRVTYYALIDYKQA
jgi:hypothetical protein